MNGLKSIDLKAYVIERLGTRMGRVMFKEDYSSCASECMCL